MTKKIFAFSLLSAGILYAAPLLAKLAGLSPMASVYAAEVERPETTKKHAVKVPAMRDRVYSQLARAQKLADEGDSEAGFAVLDQVKDRLDSLNSYEQAMLWNFYGFMQYALDDIPSAMISFEQVVKAPGIPESLLLATTFSLVQLSMQQQDYSHALSWLEKWQQANSKALTTTQQMLFAQVHFQRQEYQTSITYINKALSLSTAAGEIPKEHWLILQRAAYYELKQADNVTKVIELLVKYYDKPEYWLQLGGMYGETGQEEQQLAVMETAWQAGYIVKSSDIIALAQLYLYHGVPYKAATLLDEAMEKGDVITQTQYLDLLAQAYMQAKEEQLAIPVLKKAAEIADNGRYDAMLAQSYLNLEQWQLAISRAAKALERGELKQPGNMFLVLGMAHFNLQNYDDSIQALERAGDITQSEKMAKQWLAYVNKEKGQQMKLAMLR